MKLCNCGAKNPDNARFCALCGKNLSYVPITQEQSEQNSIVSDNNRNTGLNGNSDNSGNTNGSYVDNSRPAYNPNSPNPYSNNPNGMGMPVNNVAQPFAPSKPVLPEPVRQFREKFNKALASPLARIAGILATASCALSLIGDGGIMALWLIVGIALLIMHKKAKNNESVVGCFNAIKVYNILNIIFTSIALLASITLSSVIMAFLPELSGIAPDQKTYSLLHGILTSLTAVMAAFIPFGIATLVNSIIGLKAVGSISDAYRLGYKNSGGILAYAISFFVVAASAIVYFVASASDLTHMMNLYVKLAEESGEYLFLSSRLTLVMILIMFLIFIASVVTFGILLIKMRSAINSFAFIRPNNAVNTGAQNTAFTANNASSTSPKDLSRHLYGHGKEIPQPVVNPLANKTDSSTTDTDADSSDKSNHGSTTAE